MQFGFTLKPEHTIERTLALTRQAEAAGFDYGWLFDSHVLWRDPYPLLTLMAGATDAAAPRDVRDEPGDARADGDGLGAGDPRRDLAAAGWTSASGAAISARRVLGKPPITMANTRGGDPRHPGARRRRGRSTTRARSCASRGPRGWTLPVWVAGYGPMALAMTGRVADGRHPPAGRPGPHPLVRRPGPRGRRGGRPRPGVDPGPGRGAGPRRRPRDWAASGPAGSRPSSATTSSTSSTSTRASSCPSR